LSDWTDIVTIDASLARNIPGEAPAAKLVAAIACFGSTGHRLLIDPSRAIG
jgi:hypothetical protein